MELKFERMAGKHDMESAELEHAAVELKKSREKYLKATLYHAKEELIASRGAKNAAETTRQIRSLEEKNRLLLQMDLKTFLGLELLKVKAAMEDA